MVYGYINKDSALEVKEQIKILTGCDLIVCEPSEDYKGLSAQPFGIDTLIGFMETGDTVKVASLDALPMTLLQIIETVSEQYGKGVYVLSVKEPEATPELLHRLSEIQKKKKAGLSASALAGARARGRNGGRKKGLSAKAVKKAKAAAKLYNLGTPINEIILTLGIGSKATLYRYLKSEGVEISKQSNE